MSKSQRVHNSLAQAIPGVNWIDNVSQIVT